MPQQKRKYKLVNGQLFENRAGIYAIVNIRNQHKYVGQSYKLAERIKGHISMLRNGNHHSRYLQHAYNLYGAASFEYIVLEYVPRWSELTEREQYWIDILEPEYNAILDLSQMVGQFIEREYDELFPHPDENIERPDWHAWVYGGMKNPKKYPR